MVTHSKKILFFMLSALLSCAVAPAFADLLDNASAQTDERFLQMAASPKLLQKAQEFGEAYDTALGLAQSCNATRTVTPLNVTILKPLNYPAAGKGPVDGVWVLRYQLGRCGENKVFNALYKVNEKSQILAKPYIPGTSIANFSVVNNVIKPIKDAAVAASGIKNCEDINLLDTNVSRSPSLAGELTTWSEFWDVRVCQKNVRVPISFESNPKGNITYRLSSK